ncbi:spore germination protein [Cohnella zeiphila]|uniref:Spore germination protein n=1 Tax=Cohnella zeiphila TaxID=2761120 RepID=A0A7X0VTP8_9BACL|nr:spore germination protein [Cohnella zeiphila]MBB6730134.1 spore germination protein [Cohnella zeiphila]
MPQQPRDADEEMFLHAELQRNLDYIRNRVGSSKDLVVREFRIGTTQHKAAIVYIDNMVDKKMIGDLILRSLMVDPFLENAGEPGANPDQNRTLMNFIKENALAVGEIDIAKDWNLLFLSVMSGDTAILLDGCSEAIVSSTRGAQYRAVEEPSTQVLIRGPKDGFTESIATNVSLIRRRIKSPNLWLDSVRVGTETKTDVAILYLKGTANDDTVREIKKRLSSIDIDGVLDSGVIEELIEDEPFSVFPTILNTERPDSVAGSLLEGRVAIVMDGTPFALIAPATFTMYFQSSGDYYHSYQFGIFIRCLRLVSFLISLFGPSIYVAAISYHQEMIPTSLLISLAAQREGVPFPAFVEAFLMEGSFEILREAGVRMPRAIGQAVSIVGALVLGQAAVQAGIVSSAMVIVVSLTGIASFATPAFDLGISARLLRFTIMILAGLFGFFGITLCAIAIVAHLCGLRSFGVPYMTPFAPFHLSDQKDALLRFPVWTFKKRPSLVGRRNLVRQRGGRPPSPKPQAGKDGADES